MRPVNIEELPDILTSGQVAKACSVAARTAIKWIDSGLLQGYKIPGGKERRVLKIDMLAFMKKHRIPLNVGVKKSVIVYCQSRQNVSLLVDLIASELLLDARFVDNPFSAGTLTSEIKPCVFFMDIPKLDESILPMLQALASGPSEIIVAADEVSVNVATIDSLKVEVVRKPYRMADALSKITSLL